MRQQKYRLLCVAHPDDETIFFGGLLMKRRLGGLPWTVICMTDGNADGQGKIRRRQFEKACGQLKVTDAQWWGYPDVYEKRLPVASIVERLRELPKPVEVFTHGIIGEYGHPHHQDVSVAVHSAFEGLAPVYSAAHNAYPDLTVKISREEFELKAKILTSIYGSETQRFMNLLPATAIESFVRVELREVESIYKYLSGIGSLLAKDLEVYRWLRTFLEAHREFPRPF